MAKVPSIAAALEGLVDDPVEVRPRTQGPPPFAPEPPDDDGDGDRHGDDDDRRGTSLNNARLGMLILLGAETMFFAGLLGAFLVYRVANETWPPMSMPHLPVEVTGLNTLILLYSASTMWRANRAIRLGQQQQLRSMLLYTAVLGLVFLTVQCYEWTKLIGYGLTLSSGVYGATFYVLIGCHGLHVLGAVVWLGWVWLRATQRRYTATRRTGVVLCGMYWMYVVGLWPVLYWLVYLY
jgi:heme/copper-type cytochrome/quinol oxidase subunit 3